MKKLDALDAILNRADLKAGEKLVLLGILRHTRGDTLAGAFPSAATLACYASVRVATIWPHLRSLEKKKLLTRTSGAGGQSNAYAINAEALLQSGFQCSENTTSAENDPEENPPDLQAENPPSEQAENPPTKRDSKRESKRVESDSSLFGEDDKLADGAHNVGKAGLIAIGVRSYGEQKGQPFRSKIPRSTIRLCADRHKIPVDEAIEIGLAVLDDWVADGDPGYRAGAKPSEKFIADFAAKRRALIEGVAKVPTARKPDESRQFIDDEGYDWSEWPEKQHHMYPTPPPRVAANMRKAGIKC